MRKCIHYLIGGHKFCDSSCQFISKNNSAVENLTFSLNSLPVSATPAEAGKGETTTGV